MESTNKTDTAPDSNTTSQEQNQQGFADQQQQAMMQAQMAFQMAMQQQLNSQQQATVCFFRDVHC